MVNPFSKRRKEAIAAASVANETKEEPKVETAEPREVKKVNPFLKKKVKKEEPPQVDIETNPDDDPAIIAVADEPESEIKPKKKSRKKKETSKQKEQKEQEEQKEETQEPVAAAENAEATAEETSEESSSEEKPTVSKKTRKTAKKDADQLKAEKIMLSDYGDIFKSDLSVEESAKLVLEAYQSEEFREFKKGIYARMEEITIDPDMNPGTIRYKMHCIDALRADLAPFKANTKEALNALMQKDYGVLTAYIAEHSIGSNDLERRRNGCLSLAKFDCGGQQINMLTTMTGVKMRDEFLDTVLSELKSKQEMLNTYYGTLKVDSNLMPLADG